MGKNKIQSNIQDNIYLMSDEVMMQILLNNLLDNAIKYSPKEKSISVDLLQKNNQIFLIVKDEGIGITDIEKKKIFDKFYRSGSETTRKTKGTGLGLYLCKKIVKNHRGKIEVASNEPCGSIFTIKFDI